jgi:hypothetical protein
VALGAAVLAGVGPTDGALAAAVRGDPLVVVTSVVGDPVPEVPVHDTSPGGVGRGVEVHRVQDLGVLVSGGPAGEGEVSVVAVVTGLDLGSAVVAEVHVVVVAVPVTGVEAHTGSVDVAAVVDLQVEHLDVCSGREVGVLCWVLVRVHKAALRGYK